jgi:serine/threonine-protein kinase RsbW
VKATRTFPAIYTSLPEIGEFVEQEARSAGLDERQSYDVQLAVDEAVTNIIEHGYGEGQKGSIECSCQPRSGGLEITLKDESDFFDPDEVRAFVPGKPLTELSDRGAGLYLIKRLMDEVKFTRRKPGGNTLRLLKRSHKA